MPPLTKPPVSSTAPERTAQELLLEWLGRYFTGQPLYAATGDYTLPECDILFGDAVAPDPEELPQLHGVILQMPKEQHEWTGTDASPWVKAVAGPASGVTYGLTGQGTIEETVHGKVRRTLPGCDIRWRAVGSSFVEETLQDGMWVMTRTFANTAALRWVRDDETDPPDYVEQQMPSAAEVRRFSPVSRVWDGATIRVCGPLRILWFARVLNKGQSTQEPDSLSRAVTDGLVQLFNRADATSPLAESGLRHWNTGAVNLLPAQGMIVRSLTTTCEADYLVPVERNV